MSAFLLEVAVFGALLGLPFLYETKPAFSFYLRFLFYYLMIIVNSIALIPVFLVRMRNVENLVTASYIGRWVSNVLGLKWNIRNIERLEGVKCAIIISNHQSSLDILGLFYLWPAMRRCTVLAKSELLWAFPFGLAAWLAGLVFIPRSKTTTAKAVLNATVRQVKKEQMKLWIFPEGTRRNTGEIHDFKKGAFHAAVAEGLPIIPIVFSQYYFLDKSQKRFDTGEIIIQVLEPVITKGKTPEDVNALVKDVRGKMIDHFKEISLEIVRTTAQANLILKK